MVQTGVRSARRLDVHGTVQGVGFRPFVYRLATELGLDGSVRNDGVHVVIEAAALDQAWDELVRRLRSDAPPLARVAAIAEAVLAVCPAPGSGFRIDLSPSPLAAVSVPAGLAELPPDVAPCAECLDEVNDPGARRYRYPFTSCTSCGPRATVILDLPYDRSRTTMAGFPLCVLCAAEYADPADRRFSAEPLACPACGPTLAWRSTRWEQVAAWADDALRQAEAVVAAGGIVAVKGLGGYQLVCDAGNDSAVELLRTRKRRWAKPLAVMVPDLAMAEQLAVLGEAERLLMTSGARPIVLVATRPGGPRLAPGVHPDTDRVGLFLPSSPLHHLLLGDLGRPLVVTSGNNADEPMAIDDAVAMERLAGVADGFLGHDRPIAVRYDDSVAI
jgi:hydrogenase maturation protein HypF